MPTPSHGFVEAKIVNIIKENDIIKSISIKYVDDFIKETYGNDEVIYMDSNIQKIVKNENKNKNRPFLWMFHNKKEFPKWVTETFMKYSSCDKLKNKNKKFDYLPRQKFIRDYLGHTSPYRGLLLYHGLGTGKTCAAVAVCENLKDTRNIVIMLPKSIRENFKKGIKECGGSEYKSNNTIENRYTFITYNSSTVVKQLESIGSLDNRIIVVDEAHNLATLMVNGLRGASKNGFEIYKKLLEAKNTKIIFLTGTPIVNTPFEVALLFNILRGPLEIIMFRINNFSEDKIDDYISTLIKNDRIGWADLNRKNQSLQVILKLNSWDMEFEQTIRFIESQARYFDAYVNYDKIEEFSLFLENEDDFQKMFIKDGIFMNKDMFQRRIIGLTSFYEETNIKNINKNKNETDFPEQLSTKIVKIEMSSHQFDLYEQARKVEKKKEMQAAQQLRKKSKDEKISTLARVYSREFSNFVFPDEIIRPFQKIQFISEALQEKLKNSKNININKNINKNKNIKIKKEVLDKRVEEAINNVSDPNKKYLKPGIKGLSIYSPKMEEMLKEINNSDKELILVYSSYRTVEGLELFSRILHANGYDKYDSTDKNEYKKYAFFSGREDVPERKKIIEMFVDPDNKYGKNIKILLISSAGAEGLDLKNIRKVLIMEPYWHNVRLEQIIGRAVRKNSHIDLPENERNVQPIIYLSVLSPSQLETSKEKISTDEHVYNVALKKLKLNIDVLNAVKETAIDCMLNQCDSKKCYSFKGDGLAYMPKITEDIVYGYDNPVKIEVKRDFMTSGLTNSNEIVYLKDKKWYYATGQPFDGKPKLSKGIKYGVDLISLEVFEYESVIQGKPILIGKINEDSKLDKL